MPTLNIKIGSLEVAYEGEQSFIENGLSDFILALAKIPAQNFASPTPPVGNALSPLQENANHAAQSGVGHTTSMIAQVFSASTGPELIMAAVANLTLVKQQEKIKREDIRAEMKGATAFYKDTYGSNLTGYIGTLVKAKRLNPVSDGVYSMPNAVRQEYFEKLKND